MTGIRRVLVVGGTGFIGRAVVSRLLEAGVSVRVVSRAPDGGGDGRVEYVHASLEELCERPLLDGVDRVISVVGNLYPASVRAEPLRFVRTFFDPLAALIERCSIAGVPVLFGSSGGTVYGRSAEAAEEVRETAPTLPISHYGSLMRSVEMFLTAFRNELGVRHMSLRMSNVYGPGQRVAAGYALVPTLFERITAGKPFRIWGDGSMVRDYVYVGDVADAFVRAVRYDGDHEVLNIGSGVGTTTNDVVELVRAVTGRKIVVEHQELTGATHISRVVLDASRAQEQLGWSPVVSLRDGIRSAWSHYLSAAEQAALPLDRRGEK